MFVQFMLHNFNTLLKSFEAHRLKSKSVGQKTFGKTTLDKKLFHVFMGILDKETFRQT